MVNIYTANGSRFPVFQFLRPRDTDIFGLFYGYGLTPRARYIVAPISRSILSHVRVQ